METPLQQALSLLEDLRAQHPDEGSLGDVIQLLRAPSLTTASTTSLQVIEQQHEIAWSFDLVDECRRTTADTTPHKASSSKKSKWETLRRESMRRRVVAAFSGDVPLSPWLKPTKQPGSEAEVLRILSEGINGWTTFDPLQLHALTGRSLGALGWTIMQRTKLCELLGLSEGKMLALLGRVEDGYQAVPYHCAEHASCVTHGVFHMLTTHGELQGLVDDPIDLLSAILAAMFHDLAHDGRSNALHVATGSSLAILYSDQSVLEMHHLASAFQLLSRPECDVLASLAPDARKRVRSTIVSMVLATDLAFNYQTISDFNQMLEAGPQGAQEAEEATADAARTRHDPRLGSEGGTKLFCASDETMTQAEKIKLLKMVIKLCDIGNVTKGLEYARQASVPHRCSPLGPPPLAPLPPSPLPAPPVRPSSLH
jgi:hypothetical protein